ncbi:MAG: PepSY-associated TM helix domain-containing protein [Pseudomonadota bacterium]
MYFTHRWLGIAGCVLFVLWFVSGLVMLHVRFPALTPQERLDGLGAFDPAAATVAPQQALAALGAAAAPAAPVAPVAPGMAGPRRMVLERLGGEAAGAVPRLVWRVLDARGGHHVVAASGDPSAVPSTDVPTSPGEAVAIAAAFGQAPAHFVETREDDPWTLPNANGFEQARPLHRVALDDGAGTELYLSARTGEVVRDTSAFERRWTVFGTLLHYYTYAPIRRHADLWRQLVLWTSGLAMLSAASGLILGVLRVRLRGRYRSGAVTPYCGWMAWHHLLGLVGGVAILGWVFSGWFSMSPGGWLSHPAPASRPALFGGAQAPLPHRLEVLRQLPASARPVKTVEVGWFAGRPTWTLVDAAGERRAVDALDGRPVAVTLALLRGAVQAAYPGVPVAEVVLLTVPDRYWYGRHVSPVLPVWRIRLADPAGTWLHVDAVSGQLLGSSTADGRLKRWLFNGLHSLDLFPQLLKTPVWYTTMWLLSLAGLAVSVTGVVLGWRRLRPG